MTQNLNEENRDMTGCVMLALSTFRRSEEAAQVAVEKSRADKKLMVVYVIDINVARYLVGVEEEFFVGLKETVESEMLEKADKEAHEYVASVVAEAKKKGIQVKTLIQLGRFAVVCLEVVHKIHPSQIVTTRSQRPQWVKKFFGAPVDELMAKAGCPVIAV
jgi:nucleotide-binding universal stress UspA family protein